MVEAHQEKDNFCTLPVGDGRHFVCPGPDWFQIEFTVLLSPCSQSAFAHDLALQNAIDAFVESDFDLASQLIIHKSEHWILIEDFLQRLHDPEVGTIVEGNVTAVVVCFNRIILRPTSIRILGLQHKLNSVQRTRFIFFYGGLGINLCKVFDVGVGSLVVEGGMHHVLGLQ